MTFDLLLKGRQRVLELGVPTEQAERAILLLNSEEVEAPELLARIERLVEVAHATGSLQSAKLAYSLAIRNGLEFDSATVKLLVASLTNSDCVPAAVRLCKQAVEAGTVTSETLRTAVLLAYDSQTQQRVLESFRSHPEQVAMIEPVAESFAAPGWKAEGSWGAFSVAGAGAVWWDNARPELRENYGMSLRSSQIDLTQKLGTTLEFRCRYQILGVTDRCHLEASKDEKTWTKLCRFDGESEWQSKSIDLRPFEGQKLFLRFHVLSGGQRKGRGIEISDLQLSTVQVTRRIGVLFDELREGWVLHPSSGLSSALSGSVSESPQLSAPMNLPALEAPALCFEAKFSASSVYGEAIVELLNSDEQALAQQTLAVDSEWRAFRIPLPDEADQPVVRLSARFSQRRATDGLHVRNLAVLGGEPGERSVVLLNGAIDDGIQEQKALLTILEHGDLAELGRLLSLRRGLASLGDAIALLPLARTALDVSVLLILHSRLGSESLMAFDLLRTLPEEEDLELQCSVLLTSGMECFFSTRDHLGFGLLTLQEFEDNCRLYLQIRERWDEADTRRALSSLLTPVVTESLAERRAKFLSTLTDEMEAEEFFQAWEFAWV